LPHGIAESRVVVKVLVGVALAALFLFPSPAVEAG
jgi:hypothetical protein